MKDLTIINGDGNSVATFRSDMMDNNPSNFEILQITDDQNVIVDSILIIDRVFMKLNYGWADFTQFIADNGLSLISADTNGSGSELIVALQGGAL